MQRLRRHALAREARRDRHEGLRARGVARDLYYTEPERAALAQAEATTRLSDRADAVPDEIWKEASRGDEFAADSHRRQLVLLCADLFEGLGDGTPHVDPVWIDLGGETVLVCTGASSLKAKNTRRDPRVGLSVVSMENPYEEAQLRGRVVEQRPDRDFAVMDRITRKYTGKPFPWRDNPAERGCW